MLTDRLHEWLQGGGRLAELQAIEEAIHASFEALPPVAGEVDQLLRASCEEALKLYLEVVELGYDHLELGTDLEPARQRLSDAYCAMARHDALLDQVRQHLMVSVVERGTG